MLRKILVTVAVALTGLVMFGGVSSADVGDYGADNQVTLGVAPEDSEVAQGETFDLILGGYAPGETVDVTGTYGPGPNGLRSSRARMLLASPLSFTVVVDSNGTLSTPVSYDTPGYITFVAVGRTSGVSNTVTVKVGSGGSSGADSTTAAAAAGSGEGNNGGLAYTGQGTDGANGGLAYTGASVAGPIAIGLGALLAGLALLFFGTRGVIRHKGAKATPSI